MVLVDETPGLSDPNLTFTPVGGLSQPISGAVTPADEPVVIGSVVLSMIAGAISPAEVAEVVAVDAVSLANAGTLFPDVPTGGGDIVDPPPPRPWLEHRFRPTLLRGLPLWHPRPLMTRCWNTVSGRSYGDAVPV